MKRIARILPREEIVNGGQLVRKDTHECPKPDLVKHAIARDDEWTCPCGQKYRAYNGRGYLTWKRCWKGRKAK